MKHLIRSGSSLKKALLITVFSFILQNAWTQSFTISPSNTVSGTVEQYDYLALEIDLNNISASPIQFEYELVSNNAPASWSTVMCDYTSCFPYISSGRVMEPVSPGDHGFIKITLNPDSVIAAATIVYNVWEKGVPSTQQTITFNINSVVGVENKKPEQKMIAYPNPATDRITVSLQDGIMERGTLRIYSLTGTLLQETGIFGSASTEINIGNLAPGVYLLSCETEKGVFTQKLLKAE